MARDKAKKDRMARQAQKTTETIAHLQSQMTKIQAKIDDPNDPTPDDELLAALDEAAQSIVNQEAKLARLVS